MIRENLSIAKSKLSHLVNSAVAGEEVVIAKGGVPVVRLVPVEVPSADDPCRVVPELVLEVGDSALLPLDEQDWGDLA